MPSSPNTTFLIKAVFFILVINTISKLRISSTTPHCHKLVPVSLPSTTPKLLITFSIIMNILHSGILPEISPHYSQRMLWQSKETRLWFQRLQNLDNFCGKIWTFRSRETLCLRYFLWWWWLVWWHWLSRFSSLLLITHLNSILITT